MTVCAHEGCGWPALVQGVAEDTEDAATFIVCMLLLTTAEKAEPGMIARACEATSLAGVSDAELLAEANRRGLVGRA